MLNELKSDLRRLADPARAKDLQRFFKTGKGDYGEGDVFIGITVPEQRRVAGKYPGLALKDLQKLLSSKIHEHRLTALFILIHKFSKADDAEQKKIFDFYVRNVRRINNWDLVDLSAHKIMGSYLFDKDKAILYRFAGSKNLWERRIAVLSTFYFIKYERFDDALNIAEILLNDGHDLIHKAVGWMLREIGKRDRQTEERFLDTYSRSMPRTMLRYAIERFDEKKEECTCKNKGERRFAHAGVPPVKQ